MNGKARITRSSSQKHVEEFIKMKNENELDDPDVYEILRDQYPARLENPFLLEVTKQKNRQQRHCFLTREVKSENDTCESNSSIAISKKPNIKLEVDSDNAYVDPSYKKVEEFNHFHEFQHQSAEDEWVKPPLRSTSPTPEELIRPIWWQRYHPVNPVYLQWLVPYMVEDYTASEQLLLPFVLCIVCLIALGVACVIFVVHVLLP
jgi:hypothetical protein